jgi:hypothetical protein
MLRQREYSSRGLQIFVHICEYAYAYSFMDVCVMYYTVYVSQRESQNHALQIEIMDKRSQARPLYWKTRDILLYFLRFHYIHSTLTSHCAKLACNSSIHLFKVHFEI